MEEMNEDTIEVLLFEDLDTIHRQDWGCVTAVAAVRSPE